VAVASVDQNEEQVESAVERKPDEPIVTLKQSMPPSVTPGKLVQVEFREGERPDYMKSLTRIRGLIDGVDERV
jgi:hypothetical protein